MAKARLKLSKYTNKEELAMKEDICVYCYYARMREDICGIYCVGGCMKESDGTCKKFKEYKTNV